MQIEEKIKEGQIVICPDCKGHGFFNWGGRVSCPTCEGYGRLQVSLNTLDGFYQKNKLNFISPIPFKIGNQVKK